MVIIMVVVIDAWDCRHKCSPVHFARAGIGAHICCLLNTQSLQLCPPCHRLMQLLLFHYTACNYIPLIYTVLETQTWYPQQKIDLAKLKLEGANPVTITTKELKAGFNKSMYLTKFLECVKGHNSMRAQMPLHHLSPEEQVGVASINEYEGKVVPVPNYVLLHEDIQRSKGMTLHILNLSSR